jgi:hypothetical protein
MTRAMPNSRVSLSRRMDEFRKIVGERVQEIAQQLTELPDH